MYLLISWWIIQHIESTPNSADLHTMYMQVTYLNATVYFQHLFSAYIPPSCIINGYLAFIREVNAQLSLSHVLLSSVEVVVELWVPRPLSMRPGQWLLALLQKDLPAQGSNVLNGAQASQCWLAGQQ